jgi:predicted GIY-YIG superfamily endonuclease
MEQIYVLELEEGKYYVGKTKNIDFRIGQHFNGDGTTWTKKYKPIKIIDVKSCLTVFDEENTTIAYMKEKGIYNVRGGVYCNMVLTENEVNTIEKLIASIENKCYKCGGNHFVKECKYQKNTNEFTTKTTVEKKPSLVSIVGSFFENLVSAFDKNINKDKDKDKDEDEDDDYEEDNYEEDNYEEDNYEEDDDEEDEEDDDEEEEILQENNKGKGWDNNEEEDLRKLYIGENKDIREIAQIHGRSEGAIKARLAKLNILNNSVNNNSKQENNAHMQKYNNMSKQRWKYKIKKQNDNIDEVFCLKCGRTNHQEKNCYAKTHVDGRMLN